MIFNIFQEKALDCLSLECTKQPFCYFKARKCSPVQYLEHDVMPLCQFPRDTSCYATSSQAIAEHEHSNKEDLVQVAETKNRIYYGALKQV